MHFKDLLILILCFFIIYKAEAFSKNPNLIDDHISINCGSYAASSVALTGRQWVGDKHPNFTIKGYSSTRSTISADPVPYNTARISRSQFSYSFRLNPGKKFIRFLFSPTSYGGFERPNDLFTVEAGPFTLLANFSASLTADALAVTSFAKEFCLSIRENQPFDIVFSPATQHNAYAFINGIEIISVSSSIDYCYGGDAGIQVVGHKSAIYIDDNITALEMVHRQNIKRDFVPSADDIHAMLGMWARIFNKRSTNHASNLTWRVSVDVGFKYLIRLHFCETGLKMAETGFMDFVLVINDVIATTSAEILQEREAQGTLWYKSYVVTVNGHKREGKRDILISLHSKDEFLDGHGPLEGYEIFKLSNPDNNLASPTPLFIRRDSPSHAIQIALSVLGVKNVIATVIIAMVSLVSIIVHVLQKNWGYGFNEEENKPSTRARQLCRRFSLAEIQSATDDFNDAYVIGRGGFGKVYKGRIDNGKRETVAIKRLKPNSKQGTREFWTEIETLSELRHVNLISLIGYCNEQREMILVYEYMPCGNLADHLYKLAMKYDASSSLSWKERLEICIGAGRGIDYLHTGHRFIHRDIKGSNILLDENFVAKVSDFGLAKIESRNELESQGSTILKGTPGYIDPDYVKTRRLTTKSDTYSFGVVLLEVLCGRQAVEPWAEEGRRSLTKWALDNISNGDVDQIVAPSLRGEILHNSLITFVRITERCLHDEPKRRPTMAHVVINLEFALEQQANANFLVANEITSVADFFLSSGKVQQGNTNSLVPNKILNAGDALPCTDRTFVSMSTRQLTVASSIMKSGTSPLTEQINSKTITSGTKDGIKTTMHKLPRRLWPWDAFRKTQKSSMKKGFGSMSLSAPVSGRTNYMTSRASTLPEKRLGGSNIQMISPDLRIFSFSELKIATGNFRNDTVVGQGAFGKVYKGWLRDKHNAKKGSGNIIAVKKLTNESGQGIEQWQNEVIILGSLSHPNLVKLLGYCNWKNKKLLLVFEFMQKGSLEDNLFRRGTSVQPLPWDIRLNILIEAARGLAFLHASDKKVIHRDIKPSNILLDESYHARLSDFGLARCGPTDGSSYVLTMLAGTVGYLDPEYLQTGHLNVKSDVYSFGMVLVVTLTGLQPFDPNRPSEQHNLAHWIVRQLLDMKKLKMLMDSSLEGRYPALSALKVLELAQHCLQDESKNRPYMKQVVETLESIQDLAVEKSRQPKVQFHDHPAAA